MAAVTARFVACRDDDGASVRNALDLALENPEFGRINQIIGGVDCQKLCLDFFQIRAWIIIVLSLKRIEHIVCIISLDDLLHELVQNFVCFRK